MLVQVDVTATSEEDAIERAKDRANWEDWNEVDTPAGPEATVVNVDP